MRQDIKDTLSRLRFERDKFRAMATQCRKDAAAYRKRGRFLDGVMAMIRCQEYADDAGKTQTEIDRLKATCR